MLNKSLLTKENKNRWYINIVEHGGRNHKYAITADTSKEAILMALSTSGCSGIQKINARPYHEENEMKHFTRKFNDTEQSSEAFMNQEFEIAEEIIPYRDNTECDLDFDKDLEWYDNKEHDTITNEQESNDTLDIIYDTPVKLGSLVKQAAIKKPTQNEEKLDETVLEPALQFFMRQRFRFSTRIIAGDFKTITEKVNEEMATNFSVNQIQNVLEGLDWIEVIYGECVLVFPGKYTTELDKADLDYSILTTKDINFINHYSSKINRDLKQQVRIQILLNFKNKDKLNPTAIFKRFDTIINSDEYERARKSFEENLAEYRAKREKEYTESLRNNNTKQQNNNVKPEGNILRKE